MHDDTITAIATPLGEGGLAVVRLSGPESLAVAGRCFRPHGKTSCSPESAPTHTVHYGHVVRHGQVVDEVLVTVMRAPRTFTREDVVEISCHGGLLVAKLVLDTVLEQGARLALPGEFTRRAFLNGRLDLAQAEAVVDLIHARTELALTAANEQLSGKLSQRIRALRDQLLRVLAHVEAHLDFPEEDIQPETRGQLLERLREGMGFMDRLLETAHEGQVLRRGVRVAIIGRPNAGKSSLLNLLLGHDRAIVSHLPGTTRDTIEETADIRGLPMIFVDTAGLREGGDAVEREGIRRTRAMVDKADLVLHVLDASQPLDAADEALLDSFSGKRRILVCNKMDLPRRLVLAASDPVVEVSCVTELGLEPLKDRLQAAVWSGKIRAEMLEVMVNSRHQNALRRARTATERTTTALAAGEPLDLVALDLRTAVNAVGEIVGQTATEDLLDSIFSQFCIGK